MRSKKKFLIGIFFTFILILAVITALKLLKEKQLITKKAAPATKLSFSADKAAFKVGEEFTLKININTATNHVNGVELFVNFDSSKLTAKSVSPGDFLVDADVVNPSIENNTIHYTLLQPPGKAGVSGSGTLATIIFEPLQSGITNITFDTGKTLVVGLGEGGQNILAEALPIRISSFNPETTLSLTSSAAALVVGDEVDIAILADTGSNQISGIEFTLLYDTAKLEFVAIQPDNFLPSPDIVGPRTENNSLYYALLRPPSEDGVTGQGKVATVSFKLLAPGSTDLSFSAEETIAVGLGEAGQNLLLSTNGLELEISPGATSSPLPTELKGDINKDKVVNILDYIILLENFGKDPSSYLGVDINEDNRVNLLDYIILFENFGKEIQ